MSNIIITKENWIDVSEHQGNIDWNAVAASGVKGAIIRAGFGNDLSQIDSKFFDNIKGALAAGLKVAIYWFNYCDNVPDALQEWAVCKQIIQPYRSQIVFVGCDYEYASVSYYKRIHGTEPSPELINQMVNAFMGAAKSDGWAVKLYTNIDYSRRIFSSTTLSAWPLWFAYYSGDLGMPCDIQQTGSTGRVPGIPGNVDTNVYFNRDSVPVPAPVAVKPTISAASVKINATYRVRVPSRGWLPPVTNIGAAPNDCAGLTGEAITGIAIMVSAGYVEYRVHLLNGNRWLPKVRKYDINNNTDGYAGRTSADDEIDAIEICFYTPGNIRPYQKAVYCVAPVNGNYHGKQYDDEKPESCPDGFAGVLGEAIARVQLEIK